MRTENTQTQHTGDCRRERQGRRRRWLQIAVQHVPPQTRFQGITQRRDLGRHNLNALTNAGRRRRIERRNVPQTRIGIALNRWIHRNGSRIVTIPNADRTIHALIAQAPSL